MKTLVNKENPQIKILAPEIKLDSEGQCYIIPQGGGDHIALWKCYWDLVEIDAEQLLEEKWLEYVNKGYNEHPFEIAKYFYELGLKGRKI